MKEKIVYIEETDSTNRWLREHGGDEDCVVWANYQTDGHGQGSNHWESERGKNLTFSVLMHPTHLPANRQFHISMAVSLAVTDALGQYIGDLSVKWPNDIYWRNAKICGMLIENRLKGMQICDSIAGIGINVNQREFQSDAPNPISLWQITGQETNRQALLEDIICRMESYMLQDVRERYMQTLYRRKGFHPYCDAQGAFMARIEDVEEDGHLVLMTEDGERRRYAFKEVSFVI